mmetsp:Transcript_19947/g.50602  ORF Transcript_19947/g.50602 Transcript_19947/m.50602 type:complete len:223 (-) Transcript_19947:1085-1753(-)
MGCAFRCPFALLRVGVKGLVQLALQVRQLGGGGGHGGLDLGEQVRGLGLLAGQARPLGEGDEHRLVALACQQARARQRGAQWRARARQVVRAHGLDRHLGARVHRDADVDVHASGRGHGEAGHRLGHLGAVPCAHGARSRVGHVLAEARQRAARLGAAALLHQRVHPARKRNHLLGHLGLRGERGRLKQRGRLVGVQAVWGGVHGGSRHAQQRAHAVLVARA